MRVGRVVQSRGGWVVLSRIGRLGHGLVQRVIYVSWGGEGHGGGGRWRGVRCYGNAVSSSSTASLLDLDSPSTQVSCGAQTKKVALSQSLDKCHATARSVRLLPAVRSRVLEAWGALRPVLCERPVGCERLERTAGRVVKAGETSRGRSWRRRPCRLPLTGDGE